MLLKMSGAHSLNVKEAQLGDLTIFKWFIKQ